VKIGGGPEPPPKKYNRELERFLRAISDARYQMSINIHFDGSRSERNPRRVRARASGQPQRGNRAETKRARHLFSAYNASNRWKFRRAGASIQFARESSLNLSRRCKQICK